MRFARRAATIAAPLALLAFHAGPAGALECVRASGAAPCFATIQEAVAAASPGEAIQVYPGVYAGPVDIPAGGAKDGLQVVGMGSIPQKVVVTGASSHGFTVGAANVTIRNLTVSDAPTAGIAIDGAGARIVNVRVLNTGAGIAPAAPDVLLKNVVVSGALFDGLVANSGLNSRIRVIDSVVRNALRACMNIGGEDALVLRSRASNCGQAGIYIDNPRARVLASAVANTSFECVEIANDAGRVSGNVLAGCGYSGVGIGGDDSVVTGNLVTGSGLGVSFSCNSCAAAEIRDNVVRGARTGDAFDVSTNSAGLLVADNVAADAQFGFEVTGPGITFARNQSLFCGRGGGGGILFGSDGGVIQDSLARGSGGPGIRASGAGVVVRRNRAIENGGDGIGLFGATGALVAGNLARDNAGTGLLVDASATDTTVERNAAFRNLPDFCDSGTNTLLGAGVDANRFGTTCP